MTKNNFTNERVIPPTALTIFGATGDLSANYLIPSLVNLHCRGMLPKEFKLICVGRKDMDAKSFFEYVLKKSKTLKKILKPAHKKTFLKHLIIIIR